PQGQEEDGHDTAECSREFARAGRRPGVPTTTPTDMNRHLGPTSSDLLPARARIIRSILPQRVVDMVDEPERELLVAPWQGPSTADRCQAFAVNQTPFYRAAHLGTPSDSARPSGLTPPRPDVPRPSPGTSRR